MPRLEIGQTALDFIAFESSQFHTDGFDRVIRCVWFESHVVDAPPVLRTFIEADFGSPVGHAIVEPFLNQGGQYRRDVAPAHLTSSLCDTSEGMESE